MSIQVFLIISAILLSMPFTISFVTNNNKYLMTSSTIAIAIILGSYLYNFVI